MTERDDASREITAKLEAEGYRCTHHDVIGCEEGVLLVHGGTAGTMAIVSAEMNKLTLLTALDQLALLHPGTVVIEGDSAGNAVDDHGTPHGEIPVLSDFADRLDAIAGIFERQDRERKRGMIIRCEPMDGFRYEKLDMNLSHKGFDHRAENSAPRSQRRSR